MARGRKHQPSSIDRLPEEIRESIADLRRNGRTVNEIKKHLDALKEQGVLDDAPSRSAVGRHVKTLAEIGAEMRRTEAMAKFVVGQFGDETDDRVGRASMRILQGALLELVTEERTDEDGKPVSLSHDEARSLSLSIQRLVSAQRMDADRQLKLRKEFAAEASRKLDAAVKTGDIDADAVAKARRILGFAD